MKSDEMRAMFERWTASGLSLQGFGKREGVAYSKLLYWRRKFRDEEGAEGAEAELVPVRVVADGVAVQTKPELIGVWLPNGVALEVPLGLDGGELERLVQVLSSC